ncbi:hypothetical protein HMY34_14795 [Thiothrix subterranea]|jgi:hypothetical protein|uniref:hypothetical protein n=1 Tax=Thiothrix subterranea TaxID=2735563 RepID=UPI00192BC7DC|nr:hypothetical protein [Thiothrix subterranea]QQZ29925.1 hypothetical protein HMY34_14795 [Thiothrix subterranea]
MNNKRIKEKIIEVSELSAIKTTEQVISITYEYFIEPFLKYLTLEQKINLAKSLNQERFIIAEDFFSTKSPISSIHQKITNSNNEIAINKIITLTDIHGYGNLSRFDEVKLTLHGKVSAPNAGLTITKKLLKSLFFSSTGKIYNEQRKKTFFLKENLKNKLMQTIENEVDCQLISALFPSDLLLKQESKLSIKEYNGSLFEIIKNPSMINLFSQNTKIIGRMHGGIYGEWDFYWIENEEKKASDYYDYWHISGIDRFYKTVKPRELFRRKGSIAEILWVGRSSQREDFLETICPSYASAFSVTSHINLINNALLEVHLPFLLNPHPTGFHSAYKNIKNIKNIKRLQSEINKSTLCVFDALSHTLYYFCIKYKIPFLIIIPHIPKNLSAHYLNDLKNLKKAGILIETDDDSYDLKDMILRTINSWIDIEESIELREIYEKYKVG